MKNAHYTVWLLALLSLLGCSTAGGGETKWYKPPQQTGWQWQLNGKLNAKHDAKLYDIDLFDTPSSTIATLHKEGKKVICYFSAGSYENWRSDAGKFPKRALGNKMDGWNELWHDIRQPEIREIMVSRLDLALSKGCDGVEPDNVDGYTNDTGFDLSSSDQKEYNIFLSKEAHKRGLAIGLENDLDQIVTLEPYFDFALNEQCHQYEKCGKLKPIILASKAVFNAEYAKKYIDHLDERTDLCRKANSEKVRTLILPLEFDDSFRISCDGGKI